MALTAALLPARAHAESCFESGEVIIESDETLRCDLTVVPGSLLVKRGARIVGSANAPVGSATVLGEVSGDVAVLRDLVVEGKVGGDATAIVGNVEVTGEVEGGVTAGGDVELSGSVGGDLSAGGDIRVADSSSIGDLATVTAGGEILDAAGETLELAQAGEGPINDMASILLLALAMVVFGAVFAGLATAAIPDAIENAREASIRSTALTTFLGLVSGLVLLFTSWLIIPALIGLIGLAVGGVGLAERVGLRVAAAQGRVARAALGAALLSAVAALLLLVGAGHPVRLCLVAVPLTLLSAAALGPGLVTQFGRRAWRAEPDLATFEPSDEAADLEGEPVADPLPVEPIDGLQGAPASPSPDAPSRAPAASPIAPEPIPSPSGAPAADLESRPPVEPDGDESMPAGPTPGSGAMESADDAAVGAGLSELRRIPGITPIYAELLRAEGIDSVAAFAGLSPQRLLEIASAPGVLPIDLETAGRWLRSARELAGSE